MVNTISECLNSNEVILPLTPKNVLSMPISFTNRPASELTANKGILKRSQPKESKINDLFSNKGTNRLPYGKSFIDHIFEKYDDINAAYTIEDDKSPRKANSEDIFSDIAHRTPSPRRSDPFVTEEVKSAKRLATIEGQKDFCDILEHAGIDSSAYLAGIFSSAKRKNAQNFECSTPIACKTTVLNKSNTIATPLPLSGFRFLISPFNGSKNNSIDVNSPLTPAYQWNLTPICQLENLATILLGIICYVDVRTEKENRSDTCKRELLSIGAKVERNFTKKVTHVIFKEGKMSTYVKAKKLGIPLVSVVWIEACKLAKGPVDPTLYPPTKMEKYEEETPFTLIMKKRLRRPKKCLTNNKVVKGGSLRISPKTVCKKSNKRKAVTELKENRDPIKVLNKERHCSKKLNFIGIDESKPLEEKINLMTLDSVVNGSDNLSDSSVFAKFKLNSLPKRKSAPGALAKKKKKCLKTLNDYFVKNGINKKSENSKFSLIEDKLKNDKFLSPTNLQTDFLMVDDNDKNKLINFLPTSESKKRKLFDPSESHLTKGLQSNIDETSSKNEVLFPYSESFNAERVKNKALSKCKNNIDKMKTENSSCYKNSQLVWKDDSAMPRSSLSLFVLNNQKTVRTKLKQTPTIVFTSIHDSVCSKLALIIKKLGNFDVEDQVSEKTSHVVTNSDRRTLNLLRGIARGCWIVTLDWIFQSEVALKWLAEEHFELKSFSPAVIKCRLQKQAFKSSFQMDIFSSCGPIYVSPNTRPPMQDLIDLIKLCRGKIVTCLRGAEIIIGEKIGNDKSILRLRERWILDSISNYKLLEFSKYIINSDVNIDKSLQKKVSDNK